LGKLSGAAGISAKNLSFVFDPSLLLAGFGAIIGFRTGLSLLLGDIFSWGLLRPWGLFQGFIVPSADEPDPATMLVTEEWPGPAVATWKVVAETLHNGLGAIPVSALLAVAIGGGAGIAGAWLQHRHAPRLLPNIPAFGLTMVIPASISITMFFGSLVGKALERYQPSLAQRFLIAAASGLIAGESLTGVVRASIGIVG